MKTNPTQEFFGEVVSKTYETGYKGQTVLCIVLGEQTPSRYNKVLFEIFNHTIDLFKDVKEKDIIKINYNLEGKEWTNNKGETKFFVNARPTGFEMLKEYKPNLFDEVELPDNEDLFNEFND